MTSYAPSSTGTFVRVAAFLIMFLASLAHASTRIDLDRNWQFRADPTGAGDAAAWQLHEPEDTEPVVVPHTWNIGRLHDYLGVAWYFCHFDAASLKSARHVELHFGATFYRARVWLNGVELGVHEGGYTAYSFDVTPNLKGANSLVVRLDNRPGIATIPGFAENGKPSARYDWWTYGGIVREVWLTATGEAWVRSQAIRTEERQGTAMVHDRISLGHASRAAHAGSLISARVTVYDAGDRSVATAIQTIRDAGATDLNVDLSIRQPNLWSIDHPYLYRIRVEIEDLHHVLLDDSTDTFGVRSVEIRDRHLLLNGERVRLTGLARHEDSPWEGLAETPGTMLHDYDDLKLLHTTLTRPVHYPQNPFILDYADRNGILLIPEIPVWQFSEAQLADPRVVDLAKRQMREMIEQARNHPSIFAWSVANESAMATPAGIAYFRALRDMIRTIDPDRYVSFTDDKLPKLERADQSAANDADFVMMNQYYGSWHGTAQELIPALDKMDRLFPQKMVIISEMGFAGIFAKDPVEADQRRVQTMREQMPLLAERDWIGGVILWCYQDYKSPRNLWPGQTEGYVDHGVVDEDRQRRPSYEVWKSLTVPAKLDVHWEIAGAGPRAFSVRLMPKGEGDLPYLSLHGYRLVWRLTDETGAVAATGARELGTARDEVSFTEALGTSPGHSIKLVVALDDPSGRRVMDDTLVWPR